MKYLLILLITFVNVYSQKSFDVNLALCQDNDVFKIRYSDLNEDAIFDKLVIYDCGNIYVEDLDTYQTEGGPDIEIYKKSEFDIRLLNYNDVKEDAYFRVYVVYEGKDIGYWEHIMGSYKLIWKEQ